jgi:hypothetical protein
MLQQVEKQRPSSEGGEGERSREAWKVEWQISREAIGTNDTEDVVVDFEGLLVDA